MEEVKKVLALFDSAEKWNAFIELSNMRNAMVDELKGRLLVELQRIVNSDLVDSGWELVTDNNNISIKPKKNSTSNAHLKTNDKYISNLLETKKLNTNAVVNKPTF